MDTNENKTDREGRTVENEIFRPIGRVKYGSVEIVIHDSRVVQIEVRKKVRLGKSSRDN
jgi:hypothetical protein